MLLKTHCETAHQIREYAVLAVNIFSNIGNKTVFPTLVVLVGKHIKFSEVGMLVKHHTVFY